MLLLTSCSDQTSEQLGLALAAGCMLLRGCFPRIATPIPLTLTLTLTLTPTLTPSLTLTLALTLTRCSLAHWRLSCQARALGSRAYL